MNLRVSSSTVQLWTSSGCSSLARPCGRSARDGRVPDSDEPGGILPGATREAACGSAAHSRGRGNRGTLADHECWDRDQRGAKRLFLVGFHGIRDTVELSKCQADGRGDRADAGRLGKRRRSPGSDSRGHRLQERPPKSSEPCRQCLLPVRGTLDHRAHFAERRQRCAGPGCARRQVVPGHPGTQVWGEGWTATATHFRGQNGQHYAYNCPVPGPKDDVSGDDVWGTTTYTDDSSVCAAAVNYGLITTKAGGTVTIEIEPGAKSYAGSNRNGTTTESYGKWSGSFVFVGQAIFNTDVGYGGSGWNANATSFRGRNGQRYLYICPPWQPPRPLGHRYLHRRQLRLHCRSPRRSDHARQGRQRHDRDREGCQLVHRFH